MKDKVRKCGSSRYSLFFPSKVGFLDEAGLKLFCVLEKLLGKHTAPVEETP